MVELSDDPNFYRVGAEDKPPDIWQGIIEIGTKGTFARLYQGSEWRAKKWFTSVEMAATWLCVELKQHEEQYKKDLEQWQMKKKTLSKS